MKRRKIIFTASISPNKIKGLGVLDSVSPKMVS